MLPLFLELSSSSSSVVAVVVTRPATLIIGHEEEQLASSAGQDQTHTQPSIAQQPEKRRFLRFCLALFQGRGEGERKRLKYT